VEVFILLKETDLKSRLQMSLDVEQEEPELLVDAGVVGRQLVGLPEPLLGLYVTSFLEKWVFNLQVYLVFL
jgi:hypothetical protein